MNNKRRAETQIEDLQSDTLECQLCTMRYNNTERKPLNFNCGHTYCKVCISGMLLRKPNEILLCPECQRPQIFLVIEDLPVNYPLQS